MTRSKAYAGERVEHAVLPCAFGFVLAAWTVRGLCAVALGDAPDELEADLRRRLPHVALAAAGPAHPWADAVRARVDGEPCPPLPLDLRGSAFQLAVWDALLAIPPGRTVSYSDVARALGRDVTATRAIGAAVGANPLAVLVPCHRVVRADGGLGGYRWGTERKRALLAREAW